MDGKRRCCSSYVTETAQSPFYTLFQDTFRGCRRRPSPQLPAGPYTPCIRREPIFGLTLVVWTAPPVSPGSAITTNLYPPSMSNADPRRRSLTAIQNWRAAAKSGGDARQRVHHGLVLTALNAQFHRLSYRLLGPTLSATEEWQDAGRERTGGSLAPAVPVATRRRPTAERTCPDESPPPGRGPPAPLPPPSSRW